ncbi:MAG TPA: hypothetical protein VNC84_04530 [Gammaproteobacteria bacterium]|jgi:hypothetical protein|nr:hypothetical protein [Gammaproteobacteria bacterium]
MRNKAYQLFSTLLCLLLTGCVDKTSYTYLVQHPRFLKEQGVLCETVSPQTAYCKTVLEASVYVSGLFEAAEQDPERFGERIMQVEGAVVQAKEKYEFAKAEDSKAQRSESASTADAKKKYDDLHLEMQTLLAVVGMNGPE